MVRQPPAFDWPRRLPPARLAALLRRPGGTTMEALLAATRERRWELTQALEALRDDLGYPVRRNPETGAYYLACTSDESAPDGDDSLALLYRAIALEEFVYLMFATADGRELRLHGLPGRIRSYRGIRGFKLRQRDGSVWRIDLATVRRVQEAFGLNR
jgi:hypothetical protein